MNPEHELECPKCFARLAQEEDGWYCNGCKTPFSDDDVARVVPNAKWRRMSAVERLDELERFGREALVSEYGLTPNQLADLEAERERSTRAGAARDADVTPMKRAMKTLAKGISDEGALREMIDNALDCGDRKRPGRMVTVKIEFDREVGKVRVTDNAGGMSLDDFRRVLQLGSEGAPTDVNIIGHNGIGAKEAIYHLGSEVAIYSRELGAAVGLREIVPASWLEEASWDVSIEEFEGIEAGTTTFEISKLDKLDFDLEAISRSLWDTYERRIRDRKLEINLSPVPIVALEALEYLYPPELYPRAYRFIAGGVGVTLRIGLLSGSFDQSGVYMYVGGRQFVHWNWRDRQIAMLLQEKAPRSDVISHFRVEIDFVGPITAIPVNANKDHIDDSKPAFDLTCNVFAKVVWPYLDSISWLSQGNIRVIEHFTRSCAHKDADLEAMPIDLGKVTVLHKIPKSVCANPARMQEILGTRKDRATETRSPVTRPNPPTMIPGVPANERPAVVGNGKRETGEPKPDNGYFVVGRIVSKNQSDLSPAVLRDLQLAARAHALEVEPA